MEFRGFSGKELECLVQLSVLGRVAGLSHWVVSLCWML